MNSECAPKPLCTLTSLLLADAGITESLYLELPLPKQQRLLPGQTRTRAQVLRPAPVPLTASIIPPCPTRVWGIRNRIGWLLGHICFYSLLLSLIHINIRIFRLTRSLPLIRELKTKGKPRNRLSGEFRASPPRPWAVTGKFVAGSSGREVSAVAGLGEGQILLSLMLLRAGAVPCGEHDSKGEQGSTPSQRAQHEQRLIFGSFAPHLHSRPFLRQR